MIVVAPSLTPPAASLLGLGRAGLAGGNPAVSGLQTSLTALAQVTGRPAINPGAVDGLVGNKTMMAVIAGFNLIAEKLPSDVRTALQIALLAGGMSDKAKELVTRFASQLDLATKAATLKYAGGAAAPAAPASSSPSAPAASSAAVSWAKSPFGMLAIGLGVIGAGVLTWSLVR